jgi:predicted nucleotidyltransferase
MAPGHRAVLDSFAAACREDDGVVACFLGGSFATGKADRFSDLDIYAIVADDRWDAFFADRHAFIRKLGDPLLAEDFNQFGFDMVLFVLADGVPGELAIAPASNFLQIHGGPFIVLVDKTGVLEGVEFPYFRPEVGDRAKTARESFVFFWRNLMKFPGALGRGQLFDAFSCIELSRKRAVNLVEMVAFPDEAPTGYEKMDRLGAELAPLSAALAPTFSSLDPAALSAAARTLAGFMADRGPEIARRLGVEYPLAFAELVQGNLERAL